MANGQVLHRERKGGKDIEKMGSFFVEAEHVDFGYFLKNLGGFDFNNAWMEGRGDGEGLDVEVLKFLQEGPSFKLVF